MYNLQLKEMSVNFKIGFNSNLITNNSYTKLMGVTTDNTLSLNNHLDLLMKRIRTACYIIRYVKTYMSTYSLKVIYYAFFHSVMNYGIIFWGILLRSSIIFRTQKKAIRIMEGCGNRILCRNLFKKLQILPLTSQYMLSLIMFVVQNKFSLNKQRKSQF